jgi:uncharacterized protein (TIGR02271 family)
MTEQGQVSYDGWVGRDALDTDGDRIGEIADIYLDDVTGRPEWVAISTGLFGRRVSFAPLSGAQQDGEALRLPFATAMVKDAPNADPDGHLEPEEEAMLYRHYGLDYEAVTGTDDGHDTSGPDTDSAMTRSEEELRVDKTAHETGRARLRKYVVTENVDVTVPVQREEVRVEREPITEANADAAMDGPAISEEEHEVVLHEEEVVVDKQAVPKERVRMEKDTVVDEERVSEDVRKEVIEVDQEQSA